LHKPEITPPSNSNQSYYATADLIFLLSLLAIADKVIDSIFRNASI